MNRVTANFNMSFNEGSFKKGNIYPYEYLNEENISVTTEEGKEINFTLNEFSTLFSFLTI